MIKFGLFTLLELFALSNSTLAQSEKVVAYNDCNFQGANRLLTAIGTAVTDLIKTLVR